MCDTSMCDTSPLYDNFNKEESIGEFEIEVPTEGDFGIVIPKRRCVDAKLKKKMESAVMSILECLGQDVRREGLVDTPKRVADSLFFLTKGYYESASDLIGNALFTSNTNGMVLVKDIDFCSLCEHHMLPFHGKAHIALIPDGRVLGLSKYARIVEMYARRLQLQEQLTSQVADALVTHAKPKGVAVVFQAKHMCMSMRGAQKPGAETVTSCFRGCLENEFYRRHELISMLCSR